MSHRGSRPVRIGNGASDQLQLDIYGEALDSVFADQRGLQAGHRPWTAIRELLDWLAGHWDQPEVRNLEGPPRAQDVTYGRLMSWVAFDRGIRMAASHGQPPAVDRWTEARDAIYDQIMDKGWNPNRGAFVKHYGSEVPNSSSTATTPARHLMACRAPRARSRCARSCTSTRSRGRARRRPAGL